MNIALLGTLSNPARRMQDFDIEVPNGDECGASGCWDEANWYFVYPANGSRMTTSVYVGPRCNKHYGETAQNLADVPWFAIMREDAKAL